jgi:hypothetical protein
MQPQNIKRAKLMIDYQLQEEIRPILNAGEKLLWAGIPKRGIILKRSDAILIPFSLLWGGFAIVWETIAIVANTPWFFKLFGVPFVVVGLYLMVGRFFIDAAKRAKTIYALTNDRVIIKTGQDSIKSLQIKTLPDISLDLKKDGSGSILFGVGDMMGLKMSGSNLAGTQLGTSIDFIYDARDVYNKILDLQKQYNKQIDHNA